VNGTIINAAPLGTTKTVVSGGEPRTIQPSMKYVRLAITLFSGVGLPSATVRISATVRGSPDAMDAKEHFGICQRG